MFLRRVFLIREYNYLHKEKKLTVTLLLDKFQEIKLCFWDCTVRKIYVAHNIFYGYISVEMDFFRLWYEFWVAGSQPEQSLNVEDL